MGESAADPQGLMPIVFLYVDNCPSCATAKPRVVEFCEARSIPLVVRKPALQEARFLAAELGKIPRFPTMLVPMTDQTVVVCGDQAAGWLQENEQKVCDAYGISNRSSDHPDQGAA